MSHDALSLALSDLLLVSSTALCVPFACAVAKGYLRYYYIGLVIQHLWQTGVLAAAVVWTFNR